MQSKFSSEFSRPVDVSKLPTKGRHFHHQATAAECEQLSQRLSLLALKEMTFEAHLTPSHRHTKVHAVGRIDAIITQACSVTLEPMDTHIDMPFEIRFEEFDEAEENASHDTHKDAIMDVDLDADDPPEPIVDGALDMGEAVVQLTALEIDPFPRKPGLPFEDKAAHPRGKADEEAEIQTPNPFAVLASLKDKIK